MSLNWEIKYSNNVRYLVNGDVVEGMQMNDSILNHLHKIKIFCLRADIWSGEERSDILVGERIIREKFSSIMK